MSSQLDLFSEILHAYDAKHQGVCSNEDLYQAIAKRCDLDPALFQERVPVGEGGHLCNLMARKVRWHQQTMKHAGILERLPDARGIWRLTTQTSKGLHEINNGVSVVGFSTDLGIAILGSCDTVFAAIDAPITLTVTSPPYPLARSRDYGNVPETAYIDWILKTLEPVVKNLVQGGSICLNLSNDIFERGLPSRSMYLERLLLALHDKLGLKLMDRLVWENKSKPPGPVIWASMKRVQLNVGWEPIYWLTNDPLSVKSNNRRVLIEHTERHMRFIEQGGVLKHTVSSDGAHTKRVGSYSQATPGRIPKNVLSFAGTCGDQRQYRKHAREAGFPVHGATMPIKLASFLIELLSEPGDLVADPFGGSLTTAAAAERLGRRWLTTEKIAEYLIGGSVRFKDADGFQMNIAA